MNKLVICILVLLSSIAYAVSIDYATFEAVQIGDLQTIKSDDGFTVEHRIEFSGPGLSALAKLMPEVTDENGLVEGMHMVNITNAGQKNVAPDKTTSIYFECNVDSANKNSCNITIIKGNIPG